MFAILLTSSRFPLTASGGPDVLCRVVILVGEAERDLTVRVNAVPCVQDDRLVCDLPAAVHDCQHHIGIPLDDRCIGVVQQLLHIVVAERVGQAAAIRCERKFPLVHKSPDLGPHQIGHIRVSGIQASEFSVVDQHLLRLDAVLVGICKVNPNDGHLVHIDRNRDFLLRFEHLHGISSSLCLSDVLYAAAHIDSTPQNLDYFQCGFHQIDCTAISFTYQIFGGQLVRHGQDKSGFALFVVAGLQRIHRLVGYFDFFHGSALLGFNVFSKIDILGIAVQPLVERLRVSAFQFVHEPATNYRDVFVRVAGGQFPQIEELRGAVGFQGKSCHCLASLLYNDHLGQLVQNFVIFPVDFASVEHAVDCSEALVAIILGFDF
nr:MAG TPA: hypothetical protein [Bacteriophage sp.]